QAEPLFNRVLTSRRANLGSDHPDTLITLNNLGVVYRERGRHKEAERLLREGITGARKRLGLGHSITQNAVDHLALLYCAQGKAQLAEPGLRELIAFLRKSGQANAGTYANQLSLLSRSLLDQRKHAEAEALARESLAIRQNREPDLWTTFNTQVLLGCTLVGLRKYADAEPLLLQGYEGMKARESKMPAYAKFRLTQALEQLIALYKEWDRPDQAAKWQKVLIDKKAS